MTIEGRTDGASGSAPDAVAEASRPLATGGTLHEALASIAAAAASATGAEVVVARVLDGDAGQLKAHAVWAVSPAVAAELEGSRFAAEELPAAEVDEVARLRRERRRGRAGRRERDTRARRRGARRRLGRAADGGAGDEARDGGDGRARRPPLACGRGGRRPRAPRLVRPE